MKVGRIPYLSCEPFYFDMERRGIALYDVVPSAMAGAVAQGDIDAGPVPLADCFRLTEQCQYLSGFAWLPYVKPAVSCCTPSTLSRH